MDSKDRDLGPKTVTEADNLRTFWKRRERDVNAKVPFGLDYLDDALLGFCPGDLLLLGSRTGHGKTSFAVLTALSALRAGHRVLYIALEAYRGELGDRLTFSMLPQKYNKAGLDFMSFRRAESIEHLRPGVEEAREELMPLLENLIPIHKDATGFSVQDLKRNINSYANTVDLIILDHIHVVDNSHLLEVQKETIEALQKFAQEEHKPVLAISHVRKSGKSEWPTLSIEIDDFHGSSDLVKQSLFVATIMKDTKSTRPAPYLVPTYFTLHKSRLGRGGKNTAGRVYYDERTNLYTPGYTLGEIAWDGQNKTDFFLPAKSTPSWAKHASPPRATSSSSRNEGVPF